MLTGEVIVPAYIWLGLLLLFEVQCLHQAGIIIAV